MSGLEYMKCPRCLTKHYSWQGVVEHNRWHESQDALCTYCNGTGRDSEHPGTYACMHCGGKGLRRAS